MIPRQKLIFVIVTCVVVALVSGVIPLSIVQKISHGCPISHTVKAKLTPCFHDTVTTSFPDLHVLGGPPASVPTIPEGSPVRTAQGLHRWCIAANEPVKGPPLRC